VDYVERLSASPRRSMAPLKVVWTLERYAARRLPPVYRYRLSHRCPVGRSVLAARLPVFHHVRVGFRRCFSGSHIVGVDSRSMCPTTSPICASSLCGGRADRSADDFWRRVGPNNNVFHRRTSLTSCPRRQAGPGPPSGFHARQDEKMKAALELAPASRLGTAGAARNVVERPRCRGSGCLGTTLPPYGCRSGPRREVHVHRIGWRWILLLPSTRNCDRSSYMGGLNIRSDDARYGEITNRRGRVGKLTFTTTDAAHDQSRPSSAHCPERRGAWALVRSGTTAGSSALRTRFSHLPASPCGVCRLIATCCWQDPLGA